MSKRESIGLENESLYTFKEDTTQGTIRGFIFGAGNRVLTGREEEGS
jgi:hypothetical protein